jgi:hypothetical protein
MAIALCALLAQVARADDEGRPADLDEGYFGVELMLGFAGSVDTSSDGARIGDVEIDASGGSEEDFDTEVAIGGGLFYMRPLHRYFALGARIAVQSWRTDSNANTDRNIAFDLSLVPQGRLPLSHAVELYLSIPIGLTFDLLNELDASANFPALATGASIDTDPGFGWNLAFMFGARFAISRAVGLFGELGYALHRVSHDVRVGASAVGVTAEGTLNLNVGWSQVALNLGVYF